MGVAACSCESGDESPHSKGSPALLDSLGEDA